MARLFEYGDDQSDTTVELNTAPQRAAGMRAAFSKRLWLLGAISIAAFAMYRVSLAMFGNSSEMAMATRVLAALCTAVFVTTIWSNMDRRVLRMLIVRPRVLYFVGSVFLSEFLSLAMRWGKTEMVSVVLITVSGTATFVTVPLFDSIPRSVCSNALLRVAATLSALIKAFFIIKCKFSPHSCLEVYNDISWDVHDVEAKLSSGRSANASNVSANSSLFLNSTRPHTLLSALDVVYSCHFIILILSLQILVSSLRAPNTTNVVKQPLLLVELHGTDVLPGHANVCARLMGPRAGLLLDTYFPRRVHWFLLPAIGSLLLNRVLGESGPTLIAATASQLMFIVPFGLCLRISVLNRLSGSSGVYHYAVSIIAGSSMDGLIYGPKVYTSNGRTDTALLIIYAAHKFVLTLVLLVCLPLMDAVHTRLATPRVRITGYFFITVYNLYLYVSTKINTAHIYSTINVPEVVVEHKEFKQSFVQLSSLDVII